MCTSHCNLRPNRRFYDRKCNYDSIESRPWLKLETCQMGQVHFDYRVSSGCSLSDFIWISSPRTIINRIGQHHSRARASAIIVSNAFTPVSQVRIRKSEWEPSRSSALLKVTTAGPGRRATFLSARQSNKVRTVRGLLEIELIRLYMV